MPRPRRASAASSQSVRPQQGTVYVTRQVHFNAGHRLNNPTKSAAWNKKMFGLCNNAFGHGHNYVLEATVRGQPDPETGYVIDLGVLKEILDRVVVQPCDHRSLNDQVPFLKGVIPSTENLVIAFWNQIEPHIVGGRLDAVRLYETPRNFAEYRGPDIR